MPDLFQIGVSGLQAARTQLDITSHNIANVNTEGYSRQIVNQITQKPFQSGTYFTGTGVKVNEIKRVFQEFSYNEMVQNKTLSSSNETLYNFMSRLDKTLTSIGATIPQGINGLFDAVNAVVDNPSDLGNRNLMLEKAQAAVFSLNNLASDLESQRLFTNDNIDTICDQVTNLGQEIARLNLEITGLAGAGGEPNDLLDQRDRLILELSELTTVSTLRHEDGAVDVMISNSQPFVVRNNAYNLVRVQGEPYGINSTVALEEPRNLNSIQLRLDSTELGGELGSVFEYRDTVLGPTLDDLGLTAMALADVFNWQQSQGRDLNGNTGQDLFTDINEGNARRNRVIGASTNDAASTLQLDVEITDTKRITTDEYELIYSAAGAGSYTLTNLRTGEVASLAAPGPLPAALDFSNVSATPTPINVGFNINLNTGTPIDGDRFLIRPTRKAASEIDLLIKLPEQIAASSIAELHTDENNVSNGQVRIVSVDDAAVFNALNLPLTVTVLDNPALAPANTFNYDVLDSTGASLIGGPQPYATPPLETIQIGAIGLTLEISGTPSGQAPNGPERFEIVNAFGVGNNKNALAMSEFQGEKRLQNGTQTLLDSFESLVVNIGAVTATQEIKAQTAASLFTQSYERVQETNGVNLDEEASSLLRYQQAYQASSRIITTARTLFDSLLQATR